MAIRRKSRLACATVASLAAVVVYTAAPSAAQTETASSTGAVPHAECTYFGSDRDRFNPRPANSGFEVGRLTQSFQSARDIRSPRIGRTLPFLSLRDQRTNLIDYNISAD